MIFPNGPARPPTTTRIATDAAMRDLGRQLAGLLRAGDLVILTGPLGAGKTTLVQGIGAGLGVRGPVTSPTFVIARVHPVVPPGPARRWYTRMPTVWAASVRSTIWTWTPTPRLRSRWWSGARVWPKAWRRTGSRSRSNPTRTPTCERSG